MTGFEAVLMTLRTADDAQQFDFASWTAADDDDTTERTDMTASTAGTVLNRVQRAIQLIDLFVEHVDANAPAPWAHQPQRVGPTSTVVDATGDELARRVDDGLAQLIAASDPNHWRAVRAALMATLNQPRLTSEALNSILPLTNHTLERLGGTDDMTSFYLCPACGQLQPEPQRAVHTRSHAGQPIGHDAERAAALADLGRFLTLALTSMAANDSCADEDDPAWRGPAVEQFRNDLRALGVSSTELDAYGIRASA